MPRYATTPSGRIQPKKARTTTMYKPTKMTTHGVISVFDRRKKTKASMKRLASTPGNQYGYYGY